MPSVSKTQQRLMGQALAYKRGEIKAKDLNPQYADEIKKLAKSMSEKQLKDFASTKHKNLPEKVKESNVMSFDSFNEAHKQINHKDQKLSKDMKKQSHVSSKKPSNKKLSSEDHLAEKPKKGQYREPSNKKLSSEEFLAKDHKLTHIKKFNESKRDEVRDEVLSSFKTSGHLVRYEQEIKNDMISYIDQLLDDEIDIIHQLAQLQKGEISAEDVDISKVKEMSQKVAQQMMNIMKKYMLGKG
jgi:hypothetical protein